MNGVNVFHAKELKSDTSIVWADGKWGPARPLGYDGLLVRLRIAWRVFTGRYDAVSWSGYYEEQAANTTHEAS